MGDAARTLIQPQIDAWKVGLRNISVCRMGDVELSTDGIRFDVCSELG
jgi:hypothetical protein